MSEYLQNFIPAHVRIFTEFYNRPCQNIYRILQQTMSEYLQNFKPDQDRIFTEFYNRPCQNIHRILCWIMLEYKNNLPSLVDKHRQILNIKKIFLRLLGIFNMVLI